MRKYTVELIDDGKVLSLKRTNDGFEAFEIIGALDFVKSEIIAMLKDGFKENVNETQRIVVVDYPLAIDVIPIRAYNALLDHGHCIGFNQNMKLNELFEMYRQLKKVRGMGPKTLSEIDEVFVKYGLLRI
jgi:hypothetical protein